MKHGFVRPTVIAALVVAGAAAAASGTLGTARRLLSKGSLSTTGFAAEERGRVVERAAANSGARAEAHSQQPVPLRIYDQWRTYTRRDGLPSDQVFAVRVDGERVWAGTDAGLAYLEGGRWHTLTTRDGLPSDDVISIDVNPTTRDVWLGTFAGLSRWSAGRFQTFTQLNSGLANDFVYGVASRGDEVWAATAAGAARLNTRTGEWSIFDDTNTPLHEPWAYHVTINDGMVYIAAWGGGALEYNQATGHWRDYRDPDGEFEYDLYPNDGLVHDIATAVSFVNGVLWVSTYFGLSRYDGVRWNGYFNHDSGLISNFINFVKANGSVAWVCTDLGLNQFDGTTWVTYQRDTLAAGGNILIGTSKQPSARLRSTTTLASNYVWQVDFQGDTVWVATAQGLSRGVPRPRAMATPEGVHTW